ncbi:hypothetical protein NEOLEDRAFT_1019852, partial [Neolentinus lepideus HHB14362 ss-1]
QHRWLDVLNEFDFSIHYIPGETNVLADALSRIYSDEPLRIVRAESEYVGDDGTGRDDLGLCLAYVNVELGCSCPVYTDPSVLCLFQSSPVRRSTHLAE